jgi:hypothetical protein
MAAWTSNPQGLRSMRFRMHDISPRELPVVDRREVLLRQVQRTLAAVILKLNAERLKFQRHN